MYYIHFVKSRENSSFFAANSASSSGKPGGFCVQFDLCFSGLQALKTPPALRTFPHPMRRCGRGRGLPGPLCRRPVLLRCLRRRPAPQPGTLRWGNFLTGQKVTKDPPKAGPSPALWNPPCGTGCPCILLCSALGPAGSHRGHGHSTECACFSVWFFFYCQGLTLVSRCSQRSGAWQRSSWSAGQKKRPKYR